MADAMLALSVVREMDEVGARYFALTLLEPSSRQYLVSYLHLNPRGRPPPILVLLYTAQVLHIVSYVRAHDYL